MKLKLGMVRSSLNSYYNLGMAYLHKEDRENAKKYLKRCLNASESANHQHLQAFAHSGLGEVYLEQQNFDSAHLHLTKAATIRKTLKNPIELAETLSLLGSLARQRGQYTKAEDYLERALVIGQEHNIKDLIAVASQYLSILYAETKDFEKAYQFHLQYKVMDDSIRNEDNTRKIALMESAYAFEREKEQIELANAQNVKEKEQKLAQQRMFTYASSGGLLALMIIAFFIYQNYRQKQRANHLLLEKNNEIQHQAVELEHKNHDLEELSTFKQGMTDMIAHDMKNPLNVVIGLSEGDPDPHKMKQVNQSGKLMLQLVTNMLDVQKFDQAEMELKLAPHTLLDMLVQAKFQVELLAMARSIQLDFQVAQNIQLNCDREVILRVLVNLFTNGIKYANPGGQIHVTAQLLEDRVKIAVKDSGKGIHPDVLPFIFDKFWQSEARKSGQIQSTGLGLSFCKIAIESHGGTISVDSKIDEGSTFFFDLALGQSSVSSKASSVGLSTAKYEAIQGVIEEIRAIPLYQFADIENVLGKIEDKSDTMTSWKESLITAALNWDEAQFERLLSHPQITES